LSCTWLVVPPRFFLDQFSLLFYPDALKQEYPVCSCLVCMQIDIQACFSVPFRFETAYDPHPSARGLISSPRHAGLFPLRWEGTFARKSFFFTFFSIDPSPLDRFFFFSKVTPVNNRRHGLSSLALLNLVETSPPSYRLYYREDNLFPLPVALCPF